MDAGLSVRKAAAQMGVHRTTAFRWRHRFLAVARETKDQQLGGVVEADDVGLRQVDGVVGLSNTQPRELNCNKKAPAKRGPCCLYGFSAAGYSTGSCARCAV